MPDNVTTGWCYKVGAEVHGPMSYTELRQRALTGERDSDRPRREMDLLKILDTIRLGRGN